MTRWWGSLRIQGQEKAHRHVKRNRRSSNVLPTTPLLHEVDWQACPPFNELELAYKLFRDMLKRIYVCHLFCGPNTIDLQILRCALLHTYCWNAILLRVCNANITIPAEIGYNVTTLLMCVCVCRSNAYDNFFVSCSAEMRGGNEKKTHGLWPPSASSIRDRQMPSTWSKPSTHAKY